MLLLTFVLTQASPTIALHTDTMPPPILHNTAPWHVVVPLEYSLQEANQCGKISGDIEAVLNSINGTNLQLFYCKCCARVMSQCWSIACLHFSY
mmetsp:Transcript_2830/g.7861  ORF Transcript_2830/g.7861 Transcript_2830/m.7861 type:complete len:94 (+) Transcript_2830:92-373(+)